MLFEIDKGLLFVETDWLLLAFNHLDYFSAISKKKKIKNLELEPKVISLCHLYIARPACVTMQSELANQLQVLILISLKMIMGQFQKWKLDGLFHLRNSAG